MGDGDECAPAQKGTRAEIQDAEAVSVDVIPLARVQREIHKFLTFSCPPHSCSWATSNAQVAMSSEQG